MKDPLMAAAYAIFGGVILAAAIAAWYSIRKQKKMIYRTPAVWTDDCQGKKDFDGYVVILSTRYWPANYSSKGLCSANCSFELQHGEPYSAYDNKYTDDNITLIEKEFEAATEGDVKEQVELWASEKFNEIAELLINHFKIMNEPTRTNSRRQNF